MRQPGEDGSGTGERLEIQAIRRAWSQQHHEWLEVGSTFNGQLIDSIEEDPEARRLRIVCEFGNGSKATFMTMPSDTAVEYRLKVDDGEEDDSCQSE